MPIFLVDHFDGCSPLQPCRSCQAAAFLRSKLSKPDFEQLIEIAQGADLPQTTRAADSDRIAILGKLPTRLESCLRNDNLETIGDICKRTEREMLQLPNFGRICLGELQKALARVGRKLSDIPAE